MYFLWNVPAPASLKGPAACWGAALRHYPCTSWSVEATGPLWHRLGNLGRAAGHVVLSGYVVLPASPVLTSDTVTGTFASGTPAGLAPDNCEWTGSTGSVTPGDIVPERIITKLRPNGCPKPGDDSGPPPGSRLHLQGSSGLTDRVPHDAQAEMSLR